MPPGRTCTPKTGNFQDKSFQSISSNKLLFTSKIFVGGNVPCFTLTGPSHQYSHSLLLLGNLPLNPRLRHVLVTLVRSPLRLLI